MLPVSHLPNSFHPSYLEVAGTIHFQRHQINQGRFTTTKIHFFKIASD